MSRGRVRHASSQREAHAAGLSFHSPLRRETPRHLALGRAQVPRDSPRLHRSPADSVPQAALKAPGTQRQGQPDQPVTKSSHPGPPPHAHWLSLQDSWRRDGPEREGDGPRGPTGTQTPSSQLPVLSTARALEALQVLCPQSAFTQVCHEAENGLKQPPSASVMEQGRIWNPPDLGARETLR